MKRFSRTLSLAAAAVAVASLTACVSDPYYAARPPVYAPVAQPAPYPVAPQGYVAPAAYVEYGRISNIEVLQGEERRAPSGAGAIIGGVLGAVVGNQIGHGGGRALATGVGAFGGAIAGNSVEGNQRGRIVQTYRVSVQVDRGPAKVFDVPSPGDLRIGDRVRIENNQIQRM
ncbi:MAG: glycine zipper 2TM domain-containing protein [Pseudomonadota bacterium]